jgi:hypothetical protein
MALAEPFVDIPVLSSFLESIGSYHVDLVLDPQNKLKGGLLRLYHYTDLYGLTGIIGNHDLWLTHSRYSNDDEEMTHGLSVVNAAIGSVGDAKVHDPVYLEKLAWLVNEPEGVYICCFCEKDDLLSQWRGYAANGTGVSLQFSTREFSDVAGPDNLQGLLRFWKVFYDPKTQTDIVLQAIKHYAPAANPGQALDVLARQAADAIRFFIPTFKNAGFAEESECRLVFTPAPGTPIKPRFRVSRNMLVPYYSFRELIGTGLPLLPIRQVRVGPSVQKRLNLESTRALLVQNGYMVPVVSSGTPFRA